MKSKSSLIINLAVAVSCCGIVSSSLHAQAAAAGRAISEVVENGVRQILQAGAEQAGKRAAQELAEVGGEQIVRETVAQAAREGGEALVEKLATNSSRYGLTFLKGASESPGAFARAWEAVPENLRAGALAELRREPKLMANLVAKAGNEGADVLVAAGRHPGVSSQIMKDLGGGSASALKNLTTDEAVALAKRTPALAEVATGAQRGELSAMLAKSPKRVLEWLEKHPKTLLTSAALTAFIASKDEIIGNAEHPGFIERTVGGPVVVGAWIASALLCVGLGLWLLIRLRGSHRIAEAKVRRAVERHGP